MAGVERFKQELMYGLSAGTKKCGRCREVAVVERWPLVEVRLYLRSRVDVARLIYQIYRGSEYIMLDSKSIPHRFFEVL